MPGARQEIHLNFPLMYLKIDFLKEIFYKMYFVRLVFFYKAKVGKVSDPWRIVDASLIVNKTKLTNKYSKSDAPGKTTYFRSCLDTCRVFNNALLYKRTTGYSKTKGFFSKKGLGCRQKINLNYCRYKKILYSHLL